DRGSRSRLRGRAHHRRHAPTASAAPLRTRRRRRAARAPSFAAPEPIARASRRTPVAVYKASLRARTFAEIGDDVAPHAADGPGEVERLAIRRHRELAELVNVDDVLVGIRREVMAPHLRTVKGVVEL